MSEPYEFRPMTEADLPLLHRWLNEPHVTRWWGEPAAQFDLVSGDLDVEAVDQFIVATGARPFGYIQCYDPHAWPDNGFGPQLPGTRGIDQFIGEPEMVGCGHGSAFVRQFIEARLAAGVPRVITDPVPDNARAIRAYEKAGFRQQGLVNTPNGVALLMMRDA
jgi:aminoglycoside 6'-N-acetyltransferase